MDFSGCQIAQRGEPYKNTLGVGCLFFVHGKHGKRGKFQTTEPRVQKSERYFLFI
jgi:hypothetical protein